ncbi:tetratricopeptide repeat protein [Spirulina sp. CS-785/01]|uniref:tetratricopeptide repeat protein n=1 Tax=Spirulina sp. CS-785/01 TaxID=3021716 RepID=UPI00232CE618|nr:tetratricopeptide repeat protein [Spirulina sp. CS-785/01]MDB9315971.1 tetratricopeptide repeat protein [Spirulina sp. CS-785/01]
MSSEQQEAFQKNYQAGMVALERGQYRASIAYLEEAVGLVNPYSRKGGEVQLLLVSAYQAANDLEAATTLCEKLLRHPSPSTSQQAKNLLYIINAPVLKRPEEWMTKIPDLKPIDESSVVNRYAASKTKKRKPKPKPEPEIIDPSEINTKDNFFVGVAVVLVVLGFVAFAVWGG